MSKTIVSAHGDPDGITSAVLYAKAFPNVEVYIQQEFGMFQKDTQVILDMVPKEPFTGLVIDHHPLHPENPPYKLVFGHEPASLLTYKFVKANSNLPESEIWKVVVGLVGDGAPELTPVEVWKKYPVLLERVCSLYPKGIEVNVYDNPCWLLLSSGLNALCKAGKAQQAYEVLYNAKHPLELVSNVLLKEAKEEHRKEVDSWLKDGIYTAIGEVMVGIVDSELSVEKDVAIKLAEQSHRTAIVVNLRSRNVAIRGVLGEYIQELFSDKQIIDMGGHPAFKGGKLVGDLEEVYRRVRTIGKG